VTSTSVNPGIANEQQAAFPHAAPSNPDAPHVRTAHVRVDVGADRGPLTRMWESVGFDEINWTYTATGRSLLGTFGELTERGYHVRPHYVFCSGNAFSTPHWGNGNVYHEDAEGNPSYDFTIVDQTYDAIVAAGHHVLVELAFTPRDMLPEEAAEFTVPSSPTLRRTTSAGATSWPRTCSTVSTGTAPTRCERGSGSCGTSRTSSTGAARPSSSTSSTRSRPARSGPCCPTARSAVRP
jgi:xylan 1,4-beta-xylosidase